MASDDTPAIRLAGLRKRYGTGDAAVDALKGVDMTVHAGEVVGLFGADFTWTRRRTGARAGRGEVGWTCIWRIGARTVRGVTGETDSAKRRKIQLPPDL